MAGRWRWRQGAHRAVTVLMLMLLLEVEVVRGASVQPEGRSVRTKRSDTEAEWSIWINSDLPSSGEGDFETTDSIRKVLQICTWDKDVVAAECRVTGTNDTFDSSTTAFFKDHLLQACSSHGLICLNSQQPSGLCHDYEVRFLCQATNADDDDDSSFPNVDYKIYIVMAAVPLLVVTARVLWSCCWKPRAQRRRQLQRRRAQQRDSLSSDSLSTSSSQASFDSTLAQPPPAYADLFGDTRPAPAVFSISGGQCVGCGKCLHSHALDVQGDAPAATFTVGGEGEEGPASPSSCASPVVSSPVGDDVFVTSPAPDSDVTVTSQTRTRSDVVVTSQARVTSAEAGFRPSLASSSSLQGAVALPLTLLPDPCANALLTGPCPGAPGCTCTCHTMTSAHVNLAFQWDSPDHVDTPAAVVGPGMHKPVFSFSRIGSVTSFGSYVSLTSLPNYEEALEILKKSGLFLNEEKV